MGNERLKEHRQRRGWSQEDVANKLVDVGIEIGERQLGITRGLISRWERGVSRPRSPYPKLLCQLFKATAEELGLLTSSASPFGEIRMDLPGREDDVERRAFLGLAAAAPLGMAMPSTVQPRLSRGSVEAIASVVSEYHRAIDHTPANHLIGPALAHLEHIRRLADKFGWSKELATTAANTSLLVAWLANDLGDQNLAGTQHRASVAHAHRTGSSVFEAHMAGWTSRWAAELGRPDDAARYLAHTLDLAPPSARSRLGLIEALVHADAQGKREKDKCLRALGRAEEAVGRDGDPLWLEGFPFDEARVTRYRGYCATRLELTDLASPALERVLRTAPQGLSKLRGRTLADLAMNHVHSGEIEEACRFTAEAFEVGASMGSRRLLGRVGRVRRAFPASWKGTQPVSQLDERMVDAMIGAPSS